MAKRSCSIWFALSLIGVMGIPALWVYMDQPEEVEPIVDVMQAPDLSTAITSNEPITPLEAPLNIDPRKRALGKRLFHDPLFQLMALSPVVVVMILNVVVPISFPYRKESLTEWVR
jgi:hypothetical protein